MEIINVDAILDKVFGNSHSSADVTDKDGRADSADTVKNDSVQNTSANVADHTAKIDSAGLAIEHDKEAAACVSKEKLTADVQCYSPLIYHGVIPEIFEMELAEIYALHTNCNFFAVKDFYKFYRFEEIEFSALCVGYDFENHDLIFPICENIFDKKLEDKIKYCKVKFKANDFEPENYQLADVVVRYVRWHLGAYDIVGKFKNADKKKYGTVDGKKVYGLIKPLTAADSVTDSVEIFQATEKEISDWHANISYGFVQKILRPYELGFGSVALDALKIGFDAETHSITFLIDDDWHYIKIQLTDNNVEIADERAAQKVFEYIGGIRGTRNKIYTDRIKYQPVKKLL